MLKYDGGYARRKRMYKHWIVVEQSTTGGEECGSPLTLSYFACMRAAPETSQMKFFEFALFENLNKQNNEEIIKNNCLMQKTSRDKHDKGR